MAISTLRITLENACVSFSGRPALSDASLTLGPGERLLVLGGNGSGKSTLLRLLRGDIWPDDDGRGVRAYVADNGPGRASPIGVRERCGIVSPEIQRATKRLCAPLPARTVILAGMRDAVYIQGKPSPGELAQLAKVTDLLGIAHLLDTPVEALSNGQLRAVLLARALATRPLVLFLDEFLDGLDDAAQETAARAVAKASADGAAIVLTSHQGAALPPGEAKGITLAGGRIIDAGPAAVVLARYRKAMDGPVREQAATPPAEDAPREGLPLVVLEHATVFLARKEILKDICLTVSPGGHMAVFGANGAGKSTLLRLIAGEHHPALGGRAMRPGLAAPEGFTDLREIRRRIGMVSFELEADYDKDLSALELVTSGIAATMGIYAEPSPADFAAARRWMEFFGVADLAARRLGRLSAGQTRRLFLARAMVGEPRLLLLDEPFSGLDGPSRRLAMEAVSAAARSGVTVIAAVHRRGDVIPEIQSVYRLDAGRLRLA
ncbi:MAG TPA: ATP-binding cassette domain-containing protein [Solidesulfovibrio sp.]|nr:ATP-binding cassette domain-containing protein [Solidesulfovibrio sp.]